MNFTTATAFSFAFMLFFAGPLSASPNDRIGKHMNMANCTGMVDKMPVALAFFNEFDEAGELPLDRGFAIQTMGQGQDIFSVVLPLEIKTNETSLEIVVYAALELSQRVTQFVMPKKEAFPLTLYMFGVEWGKFECRSLWFSI